MKKNKEKIVTVILIAMPLLSFCQSKDSFIIKMMNIYDSNGNVYVFEKKYDHLPTTEDTISYFKESRKKSIKELEKDLNKLNNENTSKGIINHDKKIPNGLNKKGLHKSED